MQTAMAMEMMLSLIEVCSVEPGMATIGEIVTISTQRSTQPRMKSVTRTMIWMRTAMELPMVQMLLERYSGSAIDNDQFGDPNDSICIVDEIGYVANDLDCGLSNGSQYPGADEICYNSMDDDCDGIPDSQRSVR